MTRALLTRLTLATALSLAAAPVLAFDPAEMTAAERTAFGEQVRAYILENPEIIEEALIELQRRARDRERQGQVEAVVEEAERIYEDSRDPVVGAADAPVTIVEFFDYRCPYCAMTNDWVQETLREHGDQVRFVFKEFPINGATSLEAARAALAAWRLQPDAYPEFHDAMMSAAGPLPSQRIDELAEAAGIDVDAMRSEMDSEAITEHLQDTRELAQTIGRVGTPFFIVDGTIINGADLEGLERVLDTALQQAG